MTRHVRGTHILNIIKYVKNKKGVLGEKKMWEKIDEKRGEQVKRDYSTGEFVEYDLVLDFFDVVNELFGDDTSDIPRSRDIGRHISESLGHFEYLTHAKGLKELIQKAEQNWDKVYDFGRIELTSMEEGKAVIRYYGFPENDHVCNYFQGSIEKDMEMLDLGGKIEHTACPLEGDEYIEFTLTWVPK
ncbi:MAG: hypothetical protein R6U61_08900 [Thermoplasmata archaeon]